MEQGKKNELVQLLNELDIRKRDYGITMTFPQPHQIQLPNAIKEKVEVKDGKGRNIKVNRHKFILFQGGNGSGKTFIGIYSTVLLALGDETKKYGLPFIGKKRNIRIVTKSGSNVQKTIDPYLLGDYSPVRIPPNEIKKVVKEKDILKSIKLNNGCIISILTYDQGYERIQGGTPDFLLIDEEPVQGIIWNELVARTRGEESQLCLTMTPLSGITPVYKFFYEMDKDYMAQIGINEDKIKAMVVSSLDNKHADHTGLLMLSEEERKMRIYGEFIPPTGLVYKSFSRKNNVIQWFPPSEMGEDVKYYCSIDFGHTHPTAILFMAVDGDGVVYIYDMIYKSGMSIEDMALGIMQKKSEYNIGEYEYILGDTAAKRERVELGLKGIKVTPADKSSKGENGESNRKAGIFRVNGMLANRKIIVADRCKDLITEFEQHHFKDSQKDGEVDKTQDDALDALRYFIFFYKEPKVGNTYKRKFSKQFGVKWNRKGEYNIDRNNPY